MARPSRTADLTVEEIIELATICRSSKIESRIKERAFIIMDWHEGKTYDETMELRNISRRVVAKWRNRFLKDRLEGLKDAPRSGKPVVITEAQKNKVIHLACRKPMKGYSNWSQQRIAKKVGISQTKVNTILREQDLKPHKTEYWCGKSSDPELNPRCLL